MKDLKPLIRLHQRTVDERRRALGERLAALEEALAQQTAFEAQVVREKQVAAGDFNAGLTYHSFAKQVIRVREQMARAIGLLRQEVAQAEEAVAEAFRELKKYEQVQELRDQAAKEARRHRETQMFDEVASIRFQRAHQREGEE